MQSIHRQAQLRQRLSHQFPHASHVTNADRLFEMGCDNPVSFHRSVEEQTAMHTGLLVFYQQVLMLL